MLSILMLSVATLFTCIVTLTGQYLFFFVVFMFFGIFGIFGIFVFLSCFCCFSLHIVVVPLTDSSHVESCKFGNSGGLPDTCDYGYGIYGTCDCEYPFGIDADAHCKNCVTTKNGNDYPQCLECEYGYFLPSSNRKCTHCQSLFGDECLCCQDDIGCIECKDGYKKFYDEQLSLYFCAKECVNSEWNTPTRMCHTGLYVLHFDFACFLKRFFFFFIWFFFVFFLWKMMISSTTLATNSISYTYVKMYFFKVFTESPKFVFVFFVLFCRVCVGLYLWDCI